MRKVSIFSLSIIVIVWGVYYLNFGLEGRISKQPEIWGQFGDYVGGVLNPILSFVSICLLIGSLNLQRAANASLVSEIKRQEDLEGYKKFELRFFHLIESQEKTFSRFKVRIGDMDSQEDGAIEEYNAGAAVTYIEDCLVVLVNENVDKARVIEWIDDIDIDDCLFSVVRRFYLIVKLVDESGYKKDDYYEMLINLTDIKIISLVTIACSYYDWDIVTYIKRSEILKRAGLEEFLSIITSRSGN